MKKSLTKKFLISILTLAFAVVCLGTSTFAWFAMNNKVTATGMEVKAATDGNLVINKNFLVPQNSTDIETSFAGEMFNIKPMTYDSAWKIVSDGTLTDQHTGFNTGDLTEIPSSGDVSWKESTTTVIGFYKDYLVYIASAGDKLEGKDLKVELNIDGLDELYKGALAVAFYVGETVNAALATTDYDQAAEPDEIVHFSQFTKKNDAGTEEIIDTTAQAVVIKENITEIPSCAQSAAGIPVLMRVYFDGAENAKINQNIYSVVKNPTSSALAAGAYWKVTDSTKIGDARYSQASGTLSSDETYYTVSSSAVKYINSDNLPVNSLTLTVKFIAVDAE